MQVQKKNKQLSRDVLSAIRRKAQAERTVLLLPPLSRSARISRLGLKAPVRDYVQLAADVMKKRMGLIRRCDPDCPVRLPVAPRRSKFAPDEEHTGGRDRSRLLPQIKKDTRIPSIELDPRKAVGMKRLIAGLNERAVRRVESEAVINLRKREDSGGAHRVSEEASKQVKGSSTQFESYLGTAACLDSILQTLALQTIPEVTAAINQSFDKLLFDSPTKLLVRSWVHRLPQANGQSKAEVRAVCVFECERTEKNDYRLSLRFLSSVSLEDLEEKLKQIINHFFGDSVQAAEMSVNLRHSLHPETRQLAVDAGLIAVFKKCGFKWRSINNRLDGTRITVYSINRQTVSKMRSTGDAGAASSRPILKVESCIIVDRSGHFEALSTVGSPQTAAVDSSERERDDGAHLRYHAGLAAPEEPRSPCRAPSGRPLSSRVCPSDARDPRCSCRLRLPRASGWSLAGGSRQTVWQT